MIRILIADDHAVVRAGVKTFLHGEKGMKIAGEAANGDEALELLKKKGFDLMILDISMPGRDGLEVLKDVKRLRPKLPVLILTMHPEERFAIRAFRAGASGYVTKEHASRELILAIKKISSGGKYVSEKLAETLVSELPKTVGNPPHESLSDREYRIMCLLASGENMKSIAEHLSLSYGTVFTYRKRVLKKMKLSTDVELTHYALEHGLVD